MLQALCMYVKKLTLQFSLTLWMWCISSFWCFIPSYSFLWPCGPCLCTQCSFDFPSVFYFVYVHSKVILTFSGCSHLCLSGTVSIYFDFCQNVIGWSLILLSLTQEFFWRKFLMCHCSTTVASRSISSHFLTIGMCYIVFHSLSICQNDTVYCCPRCTSSFQKWVEWYCILLSTVHK